jgi:antitoxin ParD1/3/4
LPTRNVKLTEELERFVAKKIASGRYGNASEVLRAGRRVLEHQKRVYEAKLARLREALDAGEHSGLADGDPFARVRGSLRRSRRR